MIELNTKTFHYDMRDTDNLHGGYITIWEKVLEELFHRVQYGQFVTNSQMKITLIFPFGKPEKKKVGYDKEYILLTYVSVLCFIFTLLPGI